MTANFLKNFMDLDEFLAVKDLCTGLSRTESDYAEDEVEQDLANFIDEEDIPSECSLSQFDSSSTPLATPTICGGNNSDTDEGRGESICSSENIAACSSSESMSSLNSNENYKSPRRKRKVKHVNNAEKATPKKRRRKTADSAKKSMAEKIDGESTMRSRNDRKSVDEDVKDDKYWERRRKNNQAAKRSRDLKRLREMNVKQRADSLEEENRQLREEVQKLKEYLKTLDEKVENSS